MAMDSAIPEHWTALNAAREEHRRCREDVDSLKHKCEPPCEDIKACAKCCNGILDRIHNRYRASQKQEWFSRRTAFLMTLDNMFAEAKERKLDLRTIEAAIESEKEAWYRLVLRRHPDFVSVSDRDVDQDAVKNILDDPDKTREELISTVWEAVGKPADWSARVDAFAEKAAATENEPAKLRELYVSEFFKDADGNVLEHAQPYLTMFESDPGLSMEDVVGKIISSKKESKNLQAERDRAQSEMDAVQRAKTAFEQNKAQAKGQLRDAQARAVDEKLYNLPPCATCKGNVNGAGLISCPLCQTFSRADGGSLLTVYCSDNCLEKGEGKHLEEEHCCSAGEECLRGTDLDHRSVQGEDAVACNECLAHKQATIYCHSRCAEKNIEKHRQEKHDAKTDPGEIKELVSNLGEVVDGVLRRENPGLDYKWI